MRPHLLIVGLLTIAALRCWSLSQACENVAIRDRVEIGGDEFFLADLFPPNTCREILQAAARVRIGGAPLPGGERVLPGDVVQSLLEKLSVASRIGVLEKLHVPSRITVRRSRRSLSCVEIERRIFSGHPEKLTSTPREIDCSLLPRVPESAALELTKMSWDAASASWNVFARCASAECLPFVLRLREPNMAGAMRSVVAASTSILKKPFAQPLVRRGETVTLLWDQDGIRLTIPVVCLESGEQGQRVRARVVHSGGTVSAVVVGAGMLRITS